MLSINNCNYEVDKDMLILNSDFFSNYYELSTMGENICIDVVYTIVVRNALDLIMLKYVENVYDIVLCKKLLHYFCVHDNCLSKLDKYVKNNLDFYRQCKNIELFYYEPTYVNEMNVNDCLSVLGDSFCHMNEKDFMYLLSNTDNNLIVNVDDFLPYLKYFDYKEGDCYHVETKYNQYEDIIDACWKDKFDFIKKGLIIPDNVAVLGGCINFVLNKYADINTFCGDIDLYIIGDTKQERVDRVKQCINDIKKQFHDADIIIQHYLNVYSLIIEGMPVVQIINSRETCIEDIFNVYDLSASRVGYLNGKLISNASGIKTLITQTITMNEHANTKMHRLSKYTDRGFSIQFANVNYCVDGKWLYINNIKFLMKKGKRDKYVVEYKQIQIDDIKEYDVFWLHCYVPNKTNGTYCIKNTMIIDNMLTLDDHVINYLNKKIKKQKSLYVNNKNILLSPINNTNQITMRGRYKIQYKDTIINDIPCNNICDVTVVAGLNTEDYNMYVKVIYVRVKSINTNQTNNTDKNSNMKHIESNYYVNYDTIDVKNINTDIEIGHYQYNTFYTLKLFHQYEDNLYAPLLIKCPEFTGKLTIRDNPFKSNVINKYIFVKLNEQYNNFITHIKNIEKYLNVIIKNHQHALKIKNYFYYKNFIYYPTDDGNDIPIIFLNLYDKCYLPESIFYDSDGNIIDHTLLYGKSFTFIPLLHFKLLFCTRERVLLKVYMKEAIITSSTCSYTDSGLSDQVR